MLCLLFVLSACGVWSKRHKPGLTDSPVKILTESNYTDFYQSHELALLAATHKVCARCKIFNDVLDDTAKVLSTNEPPFGVGLVNLDTYPSLGIELDIEKGPALFLVKNHDLKNAEAYVGEISQQAILRWILKQTAPPVTECDDLWSCEDPSPTDFSPIQIIAQVPNKGSEGMRIVKQLAYDNFIGSDAINQSASDDHQAFRIQYKVFVDPALNASSDNVVARLFAHHTDERRVSGQISTLQEAKNWIRMNGRPLFGSLDETTHEFYSSANKKWLVLCGDEDDFHHFKSEFRSVARVKRHEYNIVWVDSSTMMDTLTEMFGSVDCPSVLLLDELYRKFEYSTGKIRAPLILSFIEAAETGKIEPRLKSEAEEDIKIENGVLKMVNAGLVKWITANKDTLRVVYIYANWCAHCQKLTPVIQRLVERFKDDNRLSYRIKVAKMDADHNDLNYTALGSISTLPTLFLLPPSTMTRIDFGDTERTENNIFHWITSHLTKDEL